ncbi:MAG: response regulator [candidate division WOR-3 bacterium]
MERVLIVEDSIEYAEALKNILKFDYDVVIATNLEEAKEKANGNFGVFLVDIRLNESDPNNADGLLFLKWAKHKFCEVPVIMMSAYREFEEQKDCIAQMGAALFLKKPISIKDLKEGLRSVLRKT